MTFEDKEKKFRRKYQSVNYNPIRQIPCDSERWDDDDRNPSSFVRHPEVNINVIGKDNDTLAGMFCYDNDGR